MLEGGLRLTLTRVRAFLMPAKGRKPAFATRDLQEKRKSPDETDRKHSRMLNYTAAAAYTTVIPNSADSQWCSRSDSTKAEKGKAMSKKMMLLALAVVSAAFFALPAIALAQEIHLEPGNGETFSVSGTGVELRAEGEPTVTCTGTSGSGSFDVGSSTTGTFTLDFTECHVNVLFTIPCHSTGAAVNNTIATHGTFHLITTTSSRPDFQWTTAHLLIECSGISNITVTGSLIGTVTSPKCGKSSTTVGLSFTATGTTQDLLEYTGVKYDLQSRTGENAEKTAALVGNATNTTTNAQTLNCT